MEFVFVVPRFDLFPESAPHGLALFSRDEGARSNQGTGQDQRTGQDQGTGNGQSDRQRFGELVRKHGFFVERAYAERTPRLKQIIPYTLVVRGEEILLLQRTKGGGEARLHDKLSIGVGGHVNPIDAVAEPDAHGRPRPRVDDPLPAATRREVMEEELEVTGATRLTQIGLLNDDTNAVGAVHVGLVQVLELLDGDATIREVDQLRGEFVPAGELRARLRAGANFETWSALLVPELDPILERVELVSTAPTTAGATVAVSGLSSTSA